MRQGLGYKYQHQARRLADFVSFMAAEPRPSHEAGVAWATLPPLGTHPGTRLIDVCSRAPSSLTSIRDGGCRDLAVRLKRAAYMPAAR
jgi:hypothetical protein